MAMRNYEKEDSFFLLIILISSLLRSLHAQSEYEGHLRTLMGYMDKNLSGIIIAGGDGSVQEAVTGLLRRVDEVGRCAQSCLAACLAFCASGDIFEDSSKTLETSRCCVGTSYRLLILLVFLVPCVNAGCHIRCSSWNHPTGKDQLARVETLQTNVVASPVRSGAFVIAGSFSFANVWKYCLAETVV